jgi:hypothetical protein
MTRGRHRYKEPATYFAGLAAIWAGLLVVRIMVTWGDVQDFWSISLMVAHALVVGVFAVRAYASWQKERERREAGRG